MSNAMLGNFSVTSLENAGLSVQQLLDEGTSILSNAVSVTEVDSTDDANPDVLSGNYTSISIIDDSLPFHDDDLFQCGKCKVEFTTLDSFLSHKTEQCADSKNSISGDETILEDFIVLSETNDICEDVVSIVKPLSSTRSEDLSTVPNTFSGIEFTKDQLFSLNIEETQDPSTFVFSPQNVGDNCETQSILVSSELPNSPVKFSGKFLAGKCAPNLVVCTTVVSSASEIEKKEREYPNHLFFHGNMAKPLPGDVKGKTRFNCKFCNKEFAKNFDLQQHLRSHTGEKPFQCVVCGRCFTQRSNMKRHLMTHRYLPKASSMIPFSPKDREVRNVEGQFSNERESVDVQSMFACSFCEEKFDKYLKLRAHMKNHSEEKLYHCTQRDCKEIFSNLDPFIEHLKSHDKDMQYRCHTCSRVFHSLSQLSSHQLYHSVCPWSKKVGPSYFRCTKCMNKYASAEALFHHLKTASHHHACPDCDKVFPSERLLRSHLVIHGDVTPFCCPTCNKTFKRESNMKAHMLVHTGELPFECSVCSMSFSRKDRLKRHALVHQPKMFKCLFKESAGCTKEFRRKDKMRDHMAIVHLRLRKSSKRSGVKASPRRNSYTCADPIDAALDTNDLKRSLEVDRNSNENQSVAIATKRVQNSSKSRRRKATRTNRRKFPRTKTGSSNLSKNHGVELNVVESSDIHIKKESITSGDESHENQIIVTQVDYSGHDSSVLLNFSNCEDVGHVYPLSKERSHQLPKFITEKVIGCKGDLGKLHSDHSKIVQDESVITLCNPVSLRDDSKIVHDDSVITLGNPVSLRDDSKIVHDESVITFGNPASLPDDSKIIIHDESKITPADAALPASNESKIIHDESKIAHADSTLPASNESIIHDEAKITHTDSALPPSDDSKITSTDSVTHSKLMTLHGEPFHSGSNEIVNNNDEFIVTFPPIEEVPADSNDTVEVIFVPYEDLRAISRESSADSNPSNFLN